jgi:hypothetical protein
MRFKNEDSSAEERSGAVHLTWYQFLTSVLIVCLRAPDEGAILLYSSSGAIGSRIDHSLQA